jgi:succinate dehydrogenase / fumarate reductase cytochrome b subunit
LATATEVSASPVGSASFLLRRLHSLTGVLFGGYLVVHLLINATLIQGTDPDVFQKQVDKIHSLPFLHVIEWTFIYLPILFHTVYGIWITVSGKPNVREYPFGKNIFYTLQRTSAFVIVAFMFFHVLGMKGLLGDVWTFDPQSATASTVRHVRAHWIVAYLVYPVGVLASCFHLANGFWAAAITWGLTVSAQAQRRWGLACVGLFLLTFVAGMTALVAVLTSGQIVVK